MNFARMYGRISLERGITTMQKNNPQLVKELIDGIWTMDQAEFERKYNSLSDSDMTKVSRAMDREFEKNEKEFVLYGKTRS